MSNPLTRLHRTVDRTDDDQTPRYVALGSQESDAVLDALGSATSRRIYRRILEAPATSSAVADAVGTSVQNAAHHVSNLEDAGLIEPVGSRYSEKGREMTVWGAADSCVVLGAEEERARDSLADDVGRSRFSRWRRWSSAPPWRRCGPRLRPPEDRWFRRVRARVRRRPDPSRRSSPSRNRGRSSSSRVCSSSSAFASGVASREGDDSHDGERRDGGDGSDSCDDGDSRDGGQSAGVAGASFASASSVRSLSRRMRSGIGGCE
ncbi:helix-turn-helix domain-containing protein [Halogeometricum sp. CBA1124]|uniref:ArsR/SmtB family transcription factor n=1 Tax=Halogeometricum sp. CBA1124 TaxID=2668071 RepID=UPI00142B94FD|nr:helix-turn-helix domain-containing protein [Halogeometricum sp. CBA1124]MUV58858.1 helix-turn-helix domain-containing protein [Halogeometricum sp. CBA1124]